MSDQTYEIFVVDDEQTARDGIAMALEGLYEVKKFSAAEPALEALEKARPDLILLDIGLPKMNGLEALARIKKDYPEVMVIMITAYEDVETVVSAMKGGAHDYVVKPLNMDALLVTAANALETATLKKEINALHEKYLQENSPCFIGSSDAIQNVMDIVDKVVKSPDTPIHIAGETGTGKELIAQAIHHRTPGLRGPLVTVNCAAIPTELIESELFGYEKGAFSGADSGGKIGLVEKADGGALFLDEVGDLSPEAQAKVLRFLESGEYYRVGGTRQQSVKTRIVSATNKNLEKMVDEGSFRQDLYYRLAVVKVEAPSLSNRPDDIIPIAEHFLELFGNKFGQAGKKLSPEAAAALSRHHWKGNVRELRNIIERAVLVSTGPAVAPADLGLDPAQTAALGTGRAFSLPTFSPQGQDLADILKAAEKYYYEAALQASNNNESLAARSLGLSRDRFRYRRKQHE